MSDVPELLERLGGYAKVAAAIGAPAGTVAAWKHRKSIPVRHWPELTAVPATDGNDPVSYAELVAAHAQRPPAPVQTGATAA